MIKTWLIPITASILITIILLTVNLMVFVDSIILASYLEQKSKAFLTDSFISDVFEGVDSILDRSVYSSEGNFTIFKKVLEEGVGEFMNRVSKTRDFFNERGILVDFNYTINYIGTYSIEIDVKAYAKDSEGLFSFERNHKVNRILH